MKRVSICDSFDALPKSYADIFSDITSAGFFSSLPWFRHFAETALSSNDQVRIYRVEAARSVAGLSVALPMRHDTSVAGKMTSRRLVALGNYYTPLFGPITANPNRCTQEDLNLLAATLASERPKWDIVDLHPLDADSALSNGMLAAFRSAGMMAASYFCFGNWYLEVNNRSYRQYHDALPSRLRNTIRRKTERLASARRLRIEIINGGDCLDAAIAANDKD